MDKQMKWHDIKDKLPKPGDKIIAKLHGCYLSEMITMTVREGEGLSHIKEWCYDVKPLYKENK